MKSIYKIIIILIIISAVVFSFVRFSKTDKVVNVDGGENTEETVGQDVEILEDVVSPEIKKVDDSSSTFIHKKYAFSFTYPSSMKTSNFREGDGEQILFQDDANKNWFQINITPWDESGDLTVARIKKDIPDIVIKDPQSVILGPDQKSSSGPKAIIFFSKEASLGETREVWFVKNGNLYQVTTYKRLDALISQILSTLVFE
ncbi:MAG: hypothetical protein ABL899_01855 [Nitrospira sp.]